MMDVRVLIERVSQQSYPVFVLGESGTGKELTARAIHNLGPRATCPYVPVDCSSLTPSLVEAELFGHAKGAFTGAIQGREGLIEAAHMGTLFLDEIAEIPKEMQVKLLRVLQEGKVRRVGSNDTKTVDMRVIAATNRDLQEEIRAGRFREDLYYRLNVVEVQLPPLRARKADIPILVSAFIEKYECHGRHIENITADAWDKLMSFDWPGNVRQLENTIARAIALGSGPTLSRMDLFLDSECETDSAPIAQLKGQSLESVEKAAILGALREAEGSKMLAAQMLGIGKTTLYRKLRLYGEAQWQAARFRN
jgi:two-component system response regulator HydG